MCTIFHVAAAGAIHPGRTDPRVEGVLGRPSLVRRREPVLRSALVIVVPEDFAPVREGTVELPDGRTLGWAEFGDPDGDPVLWFHGTPGGRRQLPPEAPRAAVERGFRFLGVDRPGTGRSSTHQYARVADVVPDVEVLLDALGVDRLAVGGLSGGGPYALACCWGLGERVAAGAILGGIGPTRGRERAYGYPQLLVPFEPVLRCVARPLGEVLTVAARPAMAWAEPVFDLYVRVGPSADRRTLQRHDLKSVLLHDLAECLEGGLRAPLFDLVAFARDWGFSLRDVAVPVVFWHGDADGIVPFIHGSHQAGLVQDGKLIVCPEGGHFAGFELIDDVLDQLDARWPQRAGRRATV